MKVHEYDVMVFVRWKHGYDPYKDENPAIWKGNNSAIDVMTFSLYLWVRTLTIISPTCALTEIQLIKPKTANPTY